MEGQDGLPYSEQAPVFRVDFGTSGASCRKERLLRLSFWSVLLLSTVAWLGDRTSLLTCLVLCVFARWLTQRWRDVPTRWNATADCYSDHIRSIGSVWKGAIASTSYGRGGVAAFNVVAQLLVVCAHLGLLRHSRELIGIARRAKGCLGDILVMQYVYEACACCTSIVHTTADGACIHLRTLDWEMPFNLRPVTFVVEGFVNGQHLFTATTWPAYVGLLTGIRLPACLQRRGTTATAACGNAIDSGGGFSISTNFRLGGHTYKHNVLMLLAGGATIGVLLRDTLLLDCRYEEAVRRLTTSWLAAPAYITIASASDGAGLQITRHRLGQLHPLRLVHPSEVQPYDSPTGGAAPHGSGRDNECWERDQAGRVVRIRAKRIRQVAPAVVQTNIDHWHLFPDFMMSLSRQSAASALLANCGSANMKSAADVTAAVADGWRMLSRRPIFNAKTIYAVVMIPARGIYQCRVGRNTESSSSAATRALERLAL